jgi:hypothetical protein
MPNVRVTVVSIMPVPSLLRTPEFCAQRRSAVHRDRAGGALGGFVFLNPNTIAVG